MGLEQVRIKNKFPETIIQEVFENNSSFHVQKPTTGKV